MAVPNTLLTPFCSNLLTIPRNKNTKIIVQMIIATGVAKTLRIATKITTRAQTPKRVAQTNALLPHFRTFSFSDFKTVGLAIFVEDFVVLSFLISFCIFSPITITSYLTKVIVYIS